jgi:hypothetical protein
MKEADQRIAIAIADGWVQDKLRDFLWHKGTETVPTAWLPNYPKDLNAMHEAEKLDSLNTDDYRENLATVYGRATARYDFERASAANRAEAFLRTKNLWVE